MAITNHERVGKAIELLKGGLGPFVDREFKNTYKDRMAEGNRFMGEDRLNTKRPIADWDVSMLEARALVPEAIMRPAPSVRIGQVPLMAKPARMTASKKVSQPVLAIPSLSSLSDCLKA